MALRRFRFCPPSNRSIGIKRRLLGPIGYITPAEAEEAFYLNTLDMVAWSSNKSAFGKAAAVQDAYDLHLSETAPWYSSDPYGLGRLSFIRGTSGGTDHREKKLKTKVPARLRPTQPSIKNRRKADEERWRRGSQTSGRPSLRYQKSSISEGPDRSGIPLKISVNI